MFSDLASFLSLMSLAFAIGFAANDCNAKAASRNWGETNFTQQESASKDPCTQRVGGGLSSNGAIISLELKNICSMPREITACFQDASFPSSTSQLQPHGRRGYDCLTARADQGETKYFSHSFESPVTRTYAVWESDLVFSSCDSLGKIAYAFVDEGKTPQGTRLVQLVVLNQSAQLLNYNICTYAYSVCTPGKPTTPLEPGERAVSEYDILSSTPFSELRARCSLAR